MPADTEIFKSADTDTETDNFLSLDTTSIMRLKVANNAFSYFLSPDCSANPLIKIY